MQSVGALIAARLGTERATGLSLAKLARIFITHLHGDHCFGLPGLLLTLAARRPPRDDGFYAADAEFLEIVGPVGLGAFLRANLFASDSGPLGFRYRCTELVEPPAAPAPAGEDAARAVMSADAGTDVVNRGVAAFAASAVFEQSSCVAHARRTPPLAARRTPTPAPTHPRARSRRAS